MNNTETYDRVVAVGVDMQNDFLPGGSLGVNGGFEAVESFNVAGNWVRQQNGLVVFTRDWHPEKTKHFAEDGGPWPVHCVANTYGAEFGSELIVKDGDPILSKGTDPTDDGYSGFDGHAHDGLTLETILYPEKGERVAVVIGGLATDYCVEATVMDALRMSKNLSNARTLGVFALRDAMRAVNVKPQDGEQAVVDMIAAGARFVTTQELVNNQVFGVRN